MKNKQIKNLKNVRQKKVTDLKKSQFYIEKKLKQKFENR